MIRQSNPNPSTDSNDKIKDKKHMAKFSNMSNHIFPQKHLFAGQKSQNKIPAKRSNIYDVKLDKTYLCLHRPNI